MSEDVSQAKIELEYPGAPSHPCTVCATLVTDILSHGSDLYKSRMHRTPRLTVLLNDCPGQYKVGDVLRESYTVLNVIECDSTQVKYKVEIWHISEHHLLC